MKKSAFEQGFDKRHHERQSAAAKQGYVASKAAWNEYTKHHPVPEEVQKKWDEHFEEGMAVGFHGGWGHFSSLVNPWLDTPEGKKWNAEQAKKNPYN